MKNHLEIREFDLITFNEEYKEDSQYKFLHEDNYNELKNFLLTYDQGDSSDTIDFFKISVLRNVGEIIQAKNYVGVIQLKSGFQIEILPKIHAVQQDDTRRIFLQMIRSLKDFPNKVFQSANLRIDKMNLYEVFIHMYISEVLALVKKGLRSAYITVENNENFFKGKLIFREQMYRNLLHKERFYVAYDEFHLNRAENRIIKSTLLKLMQVSNSSKNKKMMRQLLAHFEMVEPSTNYDRDFSQVVIDRNTKNYELIIHWSQIFLTNKSFATFTEDTKARSLLFPMEKVFEAYVAKHLKITLSDLPWYVSTQDNGHYLFESPRRFALRPDIVITRDDGSKVILDTKWKLLSNNPSRNYGISQADMYQMYAYSKKYDTPEIWLLYPMTDKVSDENISYKAYENNELEVSVSIFFVVVANITESLEKLKEYLVAGVYEER